MAIGQFHDVTWGSVRLWCASMSTDNSRTIVVHELAEGDDHPTQDRGLAVRRVTCELLFVEMPSEATPPLERFLAFKRQVDDGEALVFQHPLGEAFYALVEDFRHDIDEDGNLSASVTFVKSADAEPPAALGAGTSSSAGEAAVSARAEELDAELEAVGLSSDVGTDAVTRQEAWNEEADVPTRDIIVDTAELSQRLGSLIEDEGLEDDLALFPAYRATIMLGAAVRSAALAALAETPRLTAIRISTPISIYALARSLYGGAEVEDRVRQILSLNDIRTPAWIPEGSIVMVPVPPRAREWWAA